MKLAGSAKNIFSKLPLSLRRRAIFLYRQRQLLSLRCPKTFTEKVNWRMVYDRRPLLESTCDKESMKQMARERAGDLVRVPQTYWFGEDLSDLDLRVLPKTWVLKPNDRSGHVFFGTKATSLSDINGNVHGWNDEIDWARMGQWAYSRARRGFLIEETIGKPGNPPSDYKFLVFDGVPAFVQVDQGRFGNHTQDIYSLDWELTGGGNSRLDRGPIVDKPRNFESMVEIAARIGSGFDYMRVDLYNVDGEVWFGEVTPYPGGGQSRITPRSLDVRLGSMWQLPRLQ